MKITTQLFLSIATLGVVNVISGFIVERNIAKSSFDGSVVNKSGIVRGATQRLVKLEINGQPNDELVERLNVLIDGLIDGNAELMLPAATDPAYVEKIAMVQEAWGNLKQTIVNYRRNPEGVIDKLIADSEEYFELTNDAVFAAEDFSLGNVQAAKQFEYITIFIQIILLAIIFWSLYRVTRTLQSAVTDVAATSTQIAASIDEQERVLSQQASSVTETTTTIEELGSSTLQSAEQAETSSSGAQQVLELSEDGSVTVSRTREGIAQLQEKVEDIAGQIVRLSEQTTQITEISDLVADLANQTNILALNAAVEAARAGEQGKGFGVVAAEVRKLADQSKTSADKIRSLATEIQQSINSSVMVTDEGTKTAVEGLRLAEETAAAFNSIAEAISTVTLNSQQIALGSKQQAVGVQQVVSAMNAINLGAQETATGLSQVKSSSRQLADIASQLQATV
ncbi:MAG: methyl-accepting chemotaxis protein [Cyanobacteria bacterium P01_H01_bin.15]